MAASRATVVAFLALAATSVYAQTSPAGDEANGTALAAPAPVSGLCQAAATCLAALEADLAADCAAFPVPTNAFPTALRKQGYNLTQLRPGLHSYYDGGYFAVLARNDKTLVVVDFPESTGTVKEDGSGTRVTDAVEEIMNGDVPDTIYMIYSHPHFDHIGTATKFYNYVGALYPDADVSIVSSAGSAAAIKAATSGKAPQVTKVIPEEGWSLELSDDVKIQLSVVGGHSVDDVLLYVPRTSTFGGFVHLVDLVFPGWVPFAYFALTKDLARYIAAHESAVKLDFAVFSGGHLTRLGTKEDVEVNLEYTRDVVAAAKAAVMTVTDFTDVLGKVGDPAAAEAGNLWFAFASVRARQSNTCFKDIVRKWGCRLGGLNEFGRTHCFTAVEYAILDV